MSFPRRFFTAFLVACCIFLQTLSPPSWADMDSALAQGKAYFTLGTFLGFEHQTGKHDFFYEWDADAQLAGGRPVSCHLRLAALNDDLVILTVFIAFNVVGINSRDLRLFTSVKVTTKQNRSKDMFDVIPIPINNAWVKSSTGTSVGKLRKVAADVKTDFMAFGPKELWGELEPGILRDGLTVGYQKSPGEFDTIFHIEQPPPASVATKMLECMGDLMKEGMRILDN